MDSYSKLSNEWEPLIYNGITNYECSTTGVIRNKKTKELLKRSIKSEEYAEQLAKKGNGRVGDQYFRVSLSNIGPKKKKMGICVHKAIWCAHNKKDYEEIPKTHQIDHINRNRQDNTLKNLELKTISENQKNKNTENMCHKRHDFPIYLYKYYGKMKGKKTKIHNFNSSNDLNNFIDDNNLPREFNYNKYKNKILLTGQRSLCMEKFAIYENGNDIIVEELLEEDVALLEENLIGKFNNAHDAAKFLENNDDYSTNKSTSDTIRGRIFNSIKKKIVIYEKIICIKGKPEILNENIKKKPIEIKGKLYYATNEGIILNEKNIKYFTSTNIPGYYVFKGLLVHRIIYAVFNDITIEELNEKYKDGYVVDHKDDNKQNNNITNLQLITHSENTQKSRDNGTIEGQVSGSLHNKNTGDKCDFNHLPQAAEWLKSQKGYEDLTTKTLRTWLSNANTEKIKNLNESTFMNGKRNNKQVNVWTNKKKEKYFGNYNNIDDALNTQCIKDNMKNIQPHRLSNIKLYEIKQEEKCNEIKDVLEYINKQQQTTNVVPLNRLKEVIDTKKVRSEVYGFSVKEKNGIFYVYNYLNPRFDMERFNEFKDKDELELYLKKKYPIKQKSSIIGRIIRDKGIIKIKRKPKLYITYEEDIYVSSKPIHNSISKKRVGYGLWWEYTEKQIHSINITWK
jgi:hypothetical protein